VAPLQPAVHATRKQRGAFATPPELVELVVANTVPPVRPGQRVSVLDPACGDGRFLGAAATRIADAGGDPIVVGVDVDDDAVRAARDLVALGPAAAHARIETDDALHRYWGDARFDVVLGNPPFLSQLAASTTRGGASRHGGGPYADAAAEFLALAVRLARPDGGRVGLVLPQSILASRDAASVRADVDRRADLIWSWWSPRRLFDAQVVVCALGFELRPASAVPATNGHLPWSRVVTDALGVPPLPALATAGTLGDRGRLSANFRDQYYGLIPAVGDDGSGPPLITSGLIDPGRCRWGERTVTFARRRLARPRVDRDRLSPTMRRWADRFAVPKVLVANQTRIIEAVADPTGAWLPGVPLITVRTSPADVWSLAAVLTSPAASAWAWRRAAGTGLSAMALRLGPRWLAELPWPAGSIDPAVEALRDGDVAACGSAVSDAYAIGADDAAVLQRWWAAHLPPA
jgi:SAM-dependent methyltransferase